jgi:hypothetical protein
MAEKGGGEIIPDTIKALKYELEGCKIEGGL